MKGTLLLAVGWLLGWPAFAGVITRWDFNSTGDADPATGTFAPAAGSGAFAVLSANSSFGSVYSASTTDPDPADNSQLRLAGFPAQGTASKTAGVELRVSTSGFHNIRLTWDQAQSNTGSRFWRIQYTPDGSSWFDHEVIEITRAGSWRKDRSVDFSNIPEAADNPSFAIRIVSEFESTAAGFGLDEYRAVNEGSSYSTQGTLWLDMLTLHGDPFPGANQPPAIPPLPAQSARVDDAIPPLAVTISDFETPADQLSLSYSVSDWTKIINIMFDGAGSERTMTILPAPGETGEVLITIRVTDAEGAAAETSFILEILPATLPPVIDEIPEQQTARGATLGPIPLPIQDPDTPAEELTVTAESSNPALLPQSGIDLAWNGAAWELALSLAPLEVGFAIVTVTASDGFAESSLSFLVEVPPPEPIALWDFNSPIPDEDPDTGAFEPVFGPGAAVLPIGETVLTIGSVGGGPTSDPAPSDRSMLRVRGWPSQGEGNKAHGIEFRASTAGFQNITLSWDQYNSGTASRFWRIQYSLDGLAFHDHAVLVNTAPSRWQTGFAVSFGSIPEANNNPDFAVRIVSEFESTAATGSEDHYAAVNDASNYSGAGTLWIDMAAIGGDPMKITNTPPEISSIPDQTVQTGILPEPIPFTISDTETNPGLLEVELLSSNPALVEPWEIWIDRYGPDCALWLPDLAGRQGSSLITVIVRDEEFEASTSFELAIPPPAPPPMLAIRRTGGTLQLAWPASALDFFPQSAANPNGPWEFMPDAPELAEDEFVIHLLPESPAAFYRLSK